VPPSGLEQQQLRRLEEPQLLLLGPSWERRLVP